jgi:antitoxin VapB
MELHIENPAIPKMAEALAIMRGISVEQAIEEALTKSIQEEEGRKERIRRILAIGAECAALPVLDPRSPDEILGYDENGLPS